MDDAENYVNRRKGRAMAQILEVFEEKLEPLLPGEEAESFKALVRKKLNGLATDVTDVLKQADGTVKNNGVAEDIHNRLSADSRPRSSTT